MPVSISRGQMVALILDVAADSGQIFSVRFVKRDGTWRLLTGRSRGRGNRSGGTWKPRERGMVFLWDVQKRAFRTANANTATQVCFDGRTYIVRED